MTTRDPYLWKWAQRLADTTDREACYVGLLCVARQLKKATTREVRLLEVEPVQRRACELDAEAKRLRSDRDFQAECWAAARGRAERILAACQSLHGRWRLERDQKETALAWHTVASVDREGFREALKLIADGCVSPAMSFAERVLGGMTAKESFAIFKDGPHG